MKQRFLTLCLFCWLMLLAIVPLFSFGHLGYFLPHLLEVGIWLLTGSSITIYLMENSVGFKDNK